MGDTRSYIDQYKEGRKRSAKYPKLNLQSGSKEKQDFFVKLLKRMPWKPATKECSGEFHEYYIHYKCGPDGDQSLICLNKTKEELKANLMKCPACARTRKILRNQDDYNASQIDLAKKQAARTRINWPVYNLETRKGVEMLEISGGAILEILDEFQDNEGQHMDLTDLRKNCALKITRTNSGMNSKYTWRAMVSPKYALTSEDVPLIKKTYLAPEEVIERLDHDAFSQIYNGDFGVDAEIHESEGPAPSELAGTDDLSGLEAPGTGNESKLSELDTPAPKQATRQREAPTANPPARERVANPPPAQKSKASAAEDDIMAELDAIANN